MIERGRRRSSPCSAAAASSAAMSAKPAQGGRRAFASLSAIRAAPTSSSRWARSGSSASSHADVTEPRQRPPRGRRARRGHQPRRRVRPQMSAVHVDGARNVAEAARDAGAEALVHVSRHRRRPTAAVRLRPDQGRGRRGGAQRLSRRDDHPPSMVFGPEDDLTNRFAGMARLPFLPVIAAQSQFPAGLCPRPRAGDRRWPRSIRSARRQDLRDRRAAGDEHARASPRDPRADRAETRNSSTLPDIVGACSRASAGFRARR